MDINEAAKEYSGKESHPLNNAFIAGAKWQEEKDKETIEVAEDHAMFAGMNMVLDNPEKYGLQKINKDGTLQNS